MTFEVIHSAAWISDTMSFLALKMVGVLKIIDRSCRLTDKSKLTFLENISGFRT